MFISAADPVTAPVGGAALDQVLGLSIAAAIVTAVLLAIAWAHRTHRIEWFDRLGKRLGSRYGEPGWSTIPTMFVASSLIVALLGFMWDVSLHAGRGRDAFHRDGVDSALHDQLGGDVEELLATLLSRQTRVRWSFG